MKFICCMIRAVLLSIPGVIFSVAVLAQGSASNLIQAQVEAMAGPGVIRVRGHRILSEGIIDKFYSNRQFEPAWTSSERVSELLGLVSTAWEHGLLPEDYFETTLRALLADQANGPSPGHVAELDILLSESLVRYAYNRRFGKVNAHGLDHNINFKRQLASGEAPEVTLQGVLDHGDIEAALRERTQHSPWYLKLQAALRQLRDQAERGGWGTVQPGATLHVNDRDSRVAQVRNRLFAGGYLDGIHNDGSDLFGPEVRNAVLRFQRKHRLDADGVIGPATLRAMNVSVGDRIDQVRTSLERLRWVTSDAEQTPDFVAVNIAGFRVYVVRNHEMVWTSRAMVGKSYRQTPVFRGDMKYMEFNPTWTVPPGILRNDVLPAIKRDVNYLSDKNMSVIDSNGKTVDPHTVDWSRYRTSAPYTFRQEPGPWNALGQVKFIFPNAHFVFLHDTSHRELFKYPQRAFSSGCIRVEHPLDLAEVLLANDPNWNRSAINRVIESKKTQRAHLQKPLPVFLLYLTAALDQDGEVVFLEDIYERDGRLLGAMEAPVTIDLPTTP